MSAEATLASPHSHFHGTVLLLAPVAFALGKPAEESPLSWGGYSMLALGYLLALVSWPLRIRLMVPFLVLALVLLILRSGPGPKRKLPWPLPLGLKERAVG